MKKLMIAAVLAAVSIQAQAQTATQQVLINTVKQYTIVVKTTHDYEQICSAAGYVRAAALQAQLADVYKEWTDQEALMCPPAKQGTIEGDAHLRAPRLANCPEKRESWASSHKVTVWCDGATAKEQELVKQNMEQALQLVPANMR
jgi:hypothetical protein